MIRHIVRLNPREKSNLRQAVNFNVSDERISMIERGIEKALDDGLSLHTLYLALGHSDLSDKYWAEYDKADETFMSGYNIGLTEIAIMNLLMRQH